MSITYELYDAPEERAKMSDWDKDYSMPIGMPEDMKQSLEQSYPRIRDWEVSRNENAANSTFAVCHTALAVDNCCLENEYIEIYLYENSDGYIHHVRVGRGSPKLVGEIQDLFSIKYVYEGQSDQLVNPKSYKDNWEPIDNAP